MLTRLTFASLLLGFATNALAQDKPNATQSQVQSKPSSKTPSAPTMQLGSLKREDYVNKECGCAYYNPTAKREDGPLLMWVNQKGQAAVKVDGRERKMKMIKEERVQKSNKPTQSKIGAGDRLLMTLKGDSISASIVNVAERNCTVGAECSHFTWQSTLNLSENDARKSLKAWAICGCPGRKVFKADRAKEEG